MEEKPAAKRKVAKSKTETKSDVKMPAAKRTKTIKLTEPETTADGWTLYPPSLIFRSVFPPACLTCPDEQQQTNQLSRAACINRL